MDVSFILFVLLGTGSLTAGMYFYYRVAQWKTHREIDELKRKLEEERE
jgi:hypothetical protein